MRRRAFTLVELLIVILILALLSALLYPVLAQARARARAGTCMGHLKAIAHAGLLYLQDYDERFPSCYQSMEYPYVMDLPQLLQPYLRNWDVLYCPERQTVLSKCLDPVEGFRPGARCMGYGYNWGSGLNWFLGTRKGDGLVRPPDILSGPMIGVLLAEVAQPARCLFVGDTNDFVFLTLLRNSMPGVRMNDDPAALTNDLGLPYEPPRHQGGNRFAFADGHVAWLPFHGGRWVDGGPWVVPDMAMYSRSGVWEISAVP